MGFVYLIYDISTDCYKIGISSKDPVKRKKQLQTGNSEELYIKHIYKSKHYKKIERTFHNMFSHCRINGEWFLLKDCDVFNFLTNCTKFEVNFEIINKEKI